MQIIQKVIEIETRGSGMYEITDKVAQFLRASGLKDGSVSVFCRHTSASLVLMENADPSAKADLEAWLDRLIDPGDPHFTHTLEGPDDMPSHIKMALTRSSETIPFSAGSLLLGTWQGIFLWEHRTSRHHRSLVLQIIGE